MNHNGEQARGSKPNLLRRNWLRNISGLKKFSHFLSGSGFLNLPDPDFQIVRVQLWIFSYFVITVRYWYQLLLLNFLSNKSRKVYLWTKRCIHGIQKNWSPKIWKSYVVMIRFGSACRKMWFHCISCLAVPRTDWRHLYSTRAVQTSTHCLPKQKIRVMRKKFA
jgi:hypothetical protein